MKVTNTNRYKVYATDTDDDSGEAVGGIYRMPGQTTEDIDNSNGLADRLLSHPGVVKTSSEQGKTFDSKAEREQRALTTRDFGENAYPVPEEERTAERSGLHITGRDSGVPVASATEAEDFDVKPGTGEDKFEGVAAVRNGEVERGDQPAAIADEIAPVVPEAGDDLNDLPVTTLKALAKERDVEVVGSGNKGGKVKADYVRALSESAATGGGGGVAVQNADSSKTVESEAVAETGGTITSEHTR